MGFLCIQPRSWFSIANNVHKLSTTRNLLKHSSLRDCETIVDNTYCLIVCAPVMSSFLSCYRVRVEFFLPFLATFRQLPLSVFNFANLVAVVLMYTHILTPSHTHVFCVFALDTFSASKRDAIISTVTFMLFRAHRHNYSIETHSRVRLFFR